MRMSGGTSSIPMLSTDLLGKKKILETVVSNVKQFSEAKRNIDPARSDTEAWALRLGRPVAAAFAKLIPDEWQSDRAKKPLILENLNLMRDPDEILKARGKTA